MSARWVDGPNGPLFCPERDSPGLPGALYNSDGAADEFGAPTDLGQHLSQTTATRMVKVNDVNGRPLDKLKCNFITE